MVKKKSSVMSTKQSNKIAIIGLGYVGLTLGLALSQKGYEVWGFDKDKNIIKTLSNGKSHIYEKNINKILKKTLNKKFFLSNKITSNFSSYIVTVGTPVENKKANLKYIKEVTINLAKTIKNKPQIIFRSTLPIGTCNKIIIPLFKKYNLHPGKNYDLSFAPERTIEGNAIEELSLLPQIIGSYNQKSFKRCFEIFSKLTKKVIDVKNFESAEIVKLINNSYRDISFAYSNQIALICKKYNLSANNVISLSNKDYPRNRVPMPSPGVGGPCLTKDPYILGNETKSNETNIFEIGRKINTKIVHELSKSISASCKNKKTKILLCGLSFKGEPKTKDYRGSGTLIFLKELKKYNIELFDPLFTKAEIQKIGAKPFEVVKNSFDKIVILNNNNYFNSKSFKLKMIKILKKKGEIYDYWNILDNEILPNKIKYFHIGQTSK
jgi:nucleotide sugar dehydrogenase